MGEKRKGKCRQRKTRVAAGTEEHLYTGRLAWHRSQRTIYMDQITMCDLPRVARLRSWVRLDMPRFNVDLVQEFTVHHAQLPDFDGYWSCFGQTFPISHALLPGIIVVDFG